MNFGLKNKIVQLTTDEELESYRMKTNEFIGVLFPLSYLRNQKIFGIKNSKSKEILGGFAYIINGPFRSIEGLPDIQKELFEARYVDYQKESMEITGLWIDPSIKKEMSMRLWFKMGTEMIRLQLKKKKYFIYCYSADKQGLGKTYDVVPSETIYIGKPKALKGLGKIEDECVQIARLSSVYKVFIKDSDFLFKRFTPQAIGSLMNFVP